MNAIDVFNGDADGICALQQLRLHRPRPDALLVTGVKRDQALLARLAGTASSRITVLDISLDRNRGPLEQLLANDNRIFYADHHYSGPIPAASSIPAPSSFEAHIDPDPRTCTALIIDRLLGGSYRPWALVGAFGDNLDEVARSQAQALGLATEDIEILRQTGQLLNYNGYGQTITDLWIHPAELFAEVRRFADPFSLYRDSALLAQLRQGYDQDLAKAARIQPARCFPGGRVFRPPPEPWAKRVVGVWANQLAREQPEMAHAVVLVHPDGSLMVSVRSPLTSLQGADSLCRQFATGGGRAAAAGINRLPAAELERFLALFARTFPSSPASVPS